MDKSSGNKFLQCRFRQSIYIHGISACKKGKGFNLLGCAIRVCAIKCFYIIHLLNLCGMSTGRTGFRYLQFTAAGKILCNLWNDHIRLVHRDYIPDTEFQFFYDADIMHTGTADSCPLQFNRFKNRHRIDQTGSWRAPLNFQKVRFFDLICPFKSKCISRKLRGSSQGISVCNVIIKCHQAVWREIILCNRCRKIFHRFIQCSTSHYPVFNHIKSLFFQPLKLSFSWVPEIYILCAYKRERIESYISASCDLIVELTYGSAA